MAALTFTNATNSLVQLSTEPSMCGRVMAVRVGIALGGTPIGAPIVGWVAKYWGPRWALGVAAASGFAAAATAAVFLTRPFRLKVARYVIDKSGKAYSSPESDILSASGNRHAADPLLAVRVDEQT